jgi:Flp pilus assembly protein TadG
VAHLQSTSRSRQRGQATVEFAVGLTMFLMVIIGAVDLGRATWVWNTMAHAAREAARYGAVPARTSTEIRNDAISRATGLGLTAGEISVTRGVCGDPSSPVVVTIDRTFTPIAMGIAAMWGGGTISMQASSSMYVEKGATCAS